MEDYILTLPLFPVEKVWSELIMLLYFGPKAGLGGVNSRIYPPPSLQDAAFRAKVKDNYYYLPLDSF